jgi:hypothetical protein
LANVAVRIQLAGTELARVRFAISPIFETVLAIDGLRVPGAHAVHLPWVTWARPKLAGIRDLALVFDLLEGRRKPAFLMPVPDERMPDLEAELRDVPARIASVLRECHDVLVAPHWSRIVAVLEADIAYRARVLADGGVESVFAELHREVHWQDGELVLYPGLRPEEPITVDLHGHGLVLSPSAFCWPRAWAAIQPVTAGVVRYPARGIATLWEDREAAAPDGLAALIGRTRAGMLALLDAPATTSDLAARLGVTSGAISQHLGVLRGAGLVVTRRDGRTLLHLRTPRADTLLL